MGGLRHKVQLSVVWCHSASSRPARNWLRSALLSWDSATHLYLKRDLSALSADSELCVCAHASACFRKYMAECCFGFLYPFRTKWLSYLKETFSTGMFQLSAQGEKSNIAVVSRFVPCNRPGRRVGRSSAAATRIILAPRWFFFSFPRWILYYYGNLTSCYECCKLS